MILILTIYYFNGDNDGDGDDDGRRKGERGHGGRGPACQKPVWAHDLWTWYQVVMRIVVVIIVIVIVMVMTRMTLSWLRVGKGIGTGFAITPLPSKHLLLPDHHHLSHLHLQHLYQLHLLLLLHLIRAPQIMESCHLRWENME